MRILFAGTPEIALPSLSALSEAHDVVAVLTNPDKPRGRKSTPEPPPVKELALDLGVPVLQPARLGSEAREMVAVHEPDLLVVVAYGRIFGPKFLALFPRGGINLHPSLLPRYRGPAPIPAAILAGDSETGITVQTLAQEMDAGDILMQVRIPLTGTETTPDLTDRASRLGASMLVDVVDQLEEDEIEPRPQNHDNATYTNMIDKSDGLVDWSATADEIYRAYRAYQPWPGIRTTFEGSGLSLLEVAPVDASVDASVDPSTDASGTEQVDSGPEPGTVLKLDKRLGILVQTGDGLLALRRLQLQSRKALDYMSFAHGTRGFLGTRLGG